MICIKNVKRYCKNYTEIENYDEAVKSDESWECHHRLETHTSDGEKRPVQLTAKELKALDMYYNRPTEELIFLTVKDHASLHLKGHTYNKGRKLSEEQKRKLSEVNKGKKLSEETKQKIANANKGKHLSDELKLKISNAQKGKKRGPASEEAKRKMSESRSKMGWKIDPETGKRVYYKKEN